MAPPINQINDIISKVQNQINVNNDKSSAIDDSHSKRFTITPNPISHFELPSQPSHKQSLETGRVDLTKADGNKADLPNETVLQGHGQFFKNMACACSKYMKKAATHLTSRVYRDGVSRRLFVARDTFSPKREKLPIVIVSLDGVFGYYDE